MRFARGSLGAFLALAIGLVASVVLNRLLGAEGRGAYVLAVKAAGLVVAWAQWGIPEVMLFAYGGRRHQQGRLIGTSLLLVLGFALLGSLLMVALYPLLADSLFRGVSLPMFALGVGSSLFGIGYLVLRRVLQLGGRLMAFNLLDVAKSAVFLLSVVGLVVALDDERQGAVLGFAATEVVMTLVVGVYLWRKVAAGWSFDLSLARDFLRSGVVVQAGVVGIFLAGQVGPYVVNLFGNLAEVGFYATALGVATYVTFVSVSVRTVLQARMPALFGRGEALADLTVVVARHAAIWLILAAAGLALLGWPLIVLLYGLEFAPAYTPLLLLLPGMVCYGLQQILASYFTAQRLYRTPAIGSWIVAAIALGLQVVATPWLGVSGAAVGLSIGYACAYIFYLVVFCRATRRPAREFVPGLEDGRFYVGLARQLASSRGSLAHSR